MNLYYTSGRCASYIRNDVFAYEGSTMIKVYAPKKEVSHETRGRYLLEGPSWELIVFEEGYRLPHNCFMLLNAANDVDRYK